MISYFSYIVVKNKEFNFTHFCHYCVLAIATTLFSGAIAKLILAPALVPALMMFGGAAIVGGATFLVSIGISMLIARYNAPEKSVSQAYRPPAAAYATPLKATHQSTPGNTPGTNRHVTFANPLFPATEVSDKLSAPKLTLGQ